MTRRITPTYTLLNQVNLTTASSSVTFSNVPQSFADLVFVHNGAATANHGPMAYFNGDTTNSNYRRIFLYGDGNSAASTASNDARLIEVSTGIGSSIAHILDYTAIDKHKIALIRSSNTSLVFAQARRWGNTAAINSITIVADAGQSFSSGTTFSLYGVVA